jgi:hypothetical protein
MGAGYAGLLVVADLVRTGDPGALGWLAIVEGWHLTLGTVSAWVLLSHASSDQGQDAALLAADAPRSEASDQGPQRAAPAPGHLQNGPAIVETPRSATRGRQ